MIDKVTSQANISSMLQTLRAYQADASNGIDAPSVDKDKSSSKVGFGDMIRQTIENVNDKQQKAQELSSAYERGEPVPLTDVVLAMQKSSRKVAEVLMDWKTTNLSIHNPQMETPLMLAAITNQLDWAQKLIERGADVNQKGWTPLHRAADRGFAPCVSLLLADPRVSRMTRTQSGKTALMLAAEKGHVKCVDHLLYYGASKTARSSEGRVGCSGGRPSTALPLLLLLIGSSAPPRRRYW